MAYVDAMFDRDQDIIRCVERKDGKRHFTEYNAKYTFYYEDAKGKYKSVYGDPLSRIVCKNTKDFRKEVAINKGKKLFESDINPIFQCLSENYLNQDAPKLNIAFFDIETDFDPERGFADPSDPFMPITSISVYLQWMETMICLAVPPKTLTMEQAEKELEGIDNVMLFEKEGDMIDTFLTLIEDADILSGWNSEGYDIPYTVNRTSRVLSKDDTRRFCLWGQLPKKREFEKYGKIAQTFDLVGRVHLDSLNLYRKYTYEERHTYRLDAIGEIEVGENKVPYEGTLDQLYNNDFRKFIEYNIQDTALLDKLDKKLRFIDLSNTVAHENTVLLQTTMGAVAVTEQAIVNEAHHRGLQVPNRPKRDDTENTQAAGAYVAFPKKGLHKWVASMDLNSLYPSVIRALNMGQETIVGQIRPEISEQRVHEDTTLKKKSFAGSWEGRFSTEEYEAVVEQRKDIPLTVDWEDGRSDVLSGAELYSLIYDNHMPWMLSSNGTIFTTEFEGVIPGLLKRWYAERKDMQAQLIKAKEANNPIEIEYWDKRQLVKKINLNSLYGAILNPGCRFFDKRIGQSTTLTGRTIVKHMSAEVNNVITGTYDHVGEAMIYGDTDSCYFSAWPILKDDVNSGKLEWNIDKCITLMDQVCEQANTTFPEFMLKAFHCPKSRSDVIAAGREIVAQSGLYITKKRYAALVVDNEGFRTDTDGKPGKVKAMGLDLRRSDTPVFMQQFLSEILLMVLTDIPQADVLERITQFRQEFSERPGWEKGSPKRANKVGHYQRLEQKQGKANMPGHVRASINWNTLKRMNGDKYSQEIVDGMKVIVCKLKQNPLGYTSVAYPTDELRIPEWFKDLPFDDTAMAETIIDNKLDNLIGVLNYPLEDTKRHNTFSSLFDFGD
ncbi:DNA polymerase domain-containing protein [bacterium]|jgi:DNA polymerase elongation subunit (family B)|nr:DNA polymerase domain-containing protein [bacterium]